MKLLSLLIPIVLLSDRNGQLSLLFINSNKGYRQVIRDGFIYKFNKQTSLKIYWICKAKNCSATIHMDTNFNYLQSNGEHIHLRETEDIELQRFREFLKDRVIDETAPISQIYDEEISKA